MGFGVLLGFLQAGSLRLAPPLCHRLRKVSKQHRHQQNDGNDQIVSTQAGIALTKQPRHNRQQQRDQEADFHDEHDRILDHISGVQLFYRTDESLFQDLRGQQLFILFLTHITKILLSPKGSDVQQWGPAPAPGRMSAQQRYTPRTQESQQNLRYWSAACQQTR